MDSDNILPNLAQDLVRIHKAISRGLSISLTNGDRFMREGFPGADIQNGFSRYVSSLAIVLSAHHGGEDVIAFPVLKAKFPEAPFERLASDHQDIESTLEKIKTALVEMKGEATHSSLIVVAEGLKKISAAWSPHIQLEEKYFSEAAIRVGMTPDEQSQVSISMAQHSQEHAIPPYLALPFVLFNLPPEDRAVMAGLLPSVVTEELVPKAWKEHWEPMKPFFLD